MYPVEYPPPPIYQGERSELRRGVGERSDPEVRDADRRYADPMPTLPPVPGVVKIVLAGTIGGKPWTNILHFQYSGTAPLDTDLNTSANDIWNNWGTDIAPLMPTGVALEVVTIEDLTSSSSASGGHSGSQPGTNPGNVAANQVCVMVKHLIARRYRGGHPRTYLPSLRQGDMLNSDQWLSSVVTNVQAGWDAFVADIIAALSWSGSATKTYVSVSYFSAHTLRVTPVVDPILGSVVEAMVATQRRRVGR